MKDVRRWSVSLLVPAAVITVVVFGISRMKAIDKAEQRDEIFAVETDLRDAVASPTPPAVLVAAGRTVLVSSLREPGRRRAELENTLLSSRRRRLKAAARPRVLGPRLSE